MHCCRDRVAGVLCAGERLRDDHTDCASFVAGYDHVVDVMFGRSHPYGRAPGAGDTQDDVR